MAHLKLVTTEPFTQQLDRVIDNENTKVLMDFSAQMTSYAENLPISWQLSHDWEHVEEREGEVQLGLAFVAQDHITFVFICIWSDYHHKHTIRYNQ